HQVLPGIHRGAPRLSPLLSVVVVKPRFNVDNEPTNAGVTPLKITDDVLGATYLDLALRLVCPREVSGWPPRTRWASARRASFDSFAWRHDRGGSRPTPSAVLSDRRREWRLIQSWTYNARVGSFRARKTIWSWKRFAPTCGRSRRLTRKVERRFC